MVKKTICILLHGFNVKDGGYGSTDMIRPIASDRGYGVKEWDYGWVNLVRLRWRNAKVAKELAKWIIEYNRKVVLIGHSNGCAIIYEALTKYGVHVEAVIFINPALDTNLPLPTDQVKRFVILYNGEDHITEYLAPAWVRFINLMPLSRMKFGKHLWGSAGRQGFTQYKRGVRVIQLDTNGLNRDADHYVSGHSAIFKTAELREYWFGKAFSLIEKEI